MRAREFWPEANALTTPRLCSFGMSCDKAPRVAPTGMPAWSHVAIAEVGRVESEACDDREGVTGPGINCDPPSTAAPAIPHEVIRGQRRREQPAAMQREGNQTQSNRSRHRGTSHARHPRHRVCDAMCSPPRLQPSRCPVRARARTQFHCVTSRDFLPPSASIPSVRAPERSPHQVPAFLAYRNRPPAPRAGALLALDA